MAMAWTVPPVTASRTRPYAIGIDLVFGNAATVSARCCSNAPSRPGATPRTLEGPGTLTAPHFQ